MVLKTFDRPEITGSFFFPRQAQPQYDGSDGIYDSTIDVGNGIQLGYRLYAGASEMPLLVYFHGNGEIVSDYDNVAALFLDSGVSLLVIDFRGYGWSTGRPTVSSLIDDLPATLDALPTITAQAQLAPQHTYIMGRSMGCIPAIHAATHHAEHFSGLIIESGFAEVAPLLNRRGLSLLLNILGDPINNKGKMQKLSIPLLVIHGERDQLIPVDQGQKLFDVAAVQHKSLRRLPNVGHNDILFAARDYFAALATFIHETHS